MRLLRALVRPVLMSAPLAAVLLGWAPPAFPHAGNSDPNDIHACVSRHTHVVRIVGVYGHCVRHHRFPAETAIHWPRTASAPAPASAPLRFVDATGRLIGLAIAPDRAVLDLGGGTLVTVGLARSGFIETSAETLLYESADCTGPALLAADAASNFTSVSNSIATYRDFSAVRSATILSTFFPGPFGGCGDSFIVDPILVAPALTFDLSTLGLVPPFTLAR